MAGAFYFTMKPKWGASVTNAGRRRASPYPGEGQSSLTGVCSLASLTISMACSQSDLFLYPSLTAIGLEFAPRKVQYHSPFEFFRMQKSRGGVIAFSATSMGFDRLTFAQPDADKPASSIILRFISLPFRFAGFWIALKPRAAAKFSQRRTLPRFSPSASRTTRFPAPRSSRRKQISSCLAAKMSGRRNRRSFPRSRRGES